MTSESDEPSDQSDMAVLSRRRYRTVKRCFVFLSICVTIYVIIYSLLSTIIFVRPIDPEYLHGDLFEPDLIKDFPGGDNVHPKIPKIVHWTYKSEILPPDFHENVKSFVDNNPFWTFYLWTDVSARKFIKDTHPELLPTYDSYGYLKGRWSHIRKADFIRYVVLYELGGIYVDLDVINYRPLDRLVNKYTCIFPTEPFEHAVLRAGAPYLINNAIMICQPKHPFIKMILDYIPRFVQFEDVNDSTGPAFITTMYMIYNNITREDGTRIAVTRQSNSPYFYKGQLPEGHDHAVYIPNSQYFCNFIDPKGIFAFYNVCNRFRTLSELQERACANLAIKGLTRDQNEFSFLQHEFYRSYGFYRFYIHWSFYKKLFSKDMHDIVPHLKIY